MDLGDRYSQLFALDQEGEVLEEGRVRTTPDDLRRPFGSMPRARVAIEAGTHSPWVGRLLAECGHEVLVANPRMIPVISESQKKSDRVDAEALARLARVDPKLLCPIKHPGPEAQRCLKAIDDIPEDLRYLLSPILDGIGEHTARIRQYDEAVEKEICEKKFPETGSMRQVGGVGALTSAAFAVVIEDPKKFEDSRDVGAYLGLAPRHHDSGEREPQLRITKTGDAMLRRLLIGSAHYILGPFGGDSDLRRHGLAIAERGGKKAKKRAVVAVARKLAVLLHRLWITGEAYDPLRNTKRKEKRQARRAGTSAGSVGKGS